MYKNNCNNCPLGDEFRIMFDTYPDLYQPEYAICDKVDLPGNICEDGHIFKNSPKKYGKRKTGNHYRRKMERKRNRKRLQILEYGYKPSIGIDKGGYWVGAKNSKAQKYLKKVSNKKVRKNPYIGNYSDYKKHFDYFWNWF